MGERTFRRWTRRYEEEGEAGLADRRLGRRSGRAAPQAEAAEVERLFRGRYAGFTVKHFHEHLRRSHGFAWGYTWTKTFLQSRGFGGQGPAPAAGGALDDATSAIYSAILVAEEGTASAFAGLAETIAAHGLPCALYTDRGSHCFHTPEAGGRWHATCRPRSGGRWPGSPTI